MQSILDPSKIYRNLSRDVVEQDLDVVSDLWNMDGRDVYRGTRDTQYTHANVYWLYDEDFNRVGLVEHSKQNHSDFRILWFFDDPFATLLQEERWEQEGSLWEVLSENATQRFLAAGWTTPKQVLEHCLHGPVRVVTPEMVANPPKVYVCDHCHKKSLDPIPHAGSYTVPLDFPHKSKIVFVDDDLVVSRSPTRTRIFSLLGFTSPPRHDAGSSEPQPRPVQEREPVQTQSAAPPPPSAPGTPPETSEPEPAEEPPPHPQEHPPPAQTPALPSRADQGIPERTRFATSRRNPDRTRRYSE